ncbi:MAG: anthranilate synthase component I [Planctomycetes bacterium]|nr:anthranilate synthase component I [Planctomycetota bacterium]
MRHYPTLDEFCRLAEDATVVPVFRRLVSDMLTPVSAYCRIAESDGSFLFESVVGGEKIGRYSFLGADPFLRIDAYDREVVVTEADGQRRLESPDPLEELGQILRRYRSARVPGVPPYCGGAVGYAGYDVIRYTEHLPNAPEDDRRLPDLSFAFYDRMIIFDHINKTIFVVAHARTDRGDLRNEYERACQAVDALCDQLQLRETGLTLADIDVTGDPQLAYRSNMTQEQFESSVRRCKEYIQAGDIFQVVISQRLELETQASAVDIYRALRVVNPSPFMFLLKTPTVALVGSSPEIMVRVEDRVVTIRPLAGTRRRGATEEEDQRLAEELLADPKERAEHVMLVDLARNDVGRVAKFGTVRLSDVMVVERYSHVMHITSNVSGQLRDDLTALDALRAGLPAGTVSGAPKVRAMEIIDEMEPHRRGPYAGAVGHLDFLGNMDTCIALRTLVLQGNKAYIQAGAGIVADSVPEREYHETLNKAKGLLKAIEIAEKQLGAGG